MRKIYGLFVFVAVLIIGCDEKRVFDEYQAVQGWHKDSLVNFEIEELDSTQVYDLFINIRNNNQYAYSNLFLITKIHFPQGKVISDTLEYEMAKPSGEWLGDGFGDIKENKLWYKEKEAKLKALKLTLDKMDKTYGKGTVMKMSDQAVVDIDAISTGSLGLDLALGVGGYPRGRVIEIYGPESSGKTTLTLHAIAEAQKKGGIAAFIDAEHAFDRFYAEKLDVDIDNLII